MNTKPIEQAKNQDLANSLPALRRAAQRARELASKTELPAPTNKKAQLSRVEKPR
jgi:hypothetical protein